MKLRWTEAASADLLAILEYIRKDNPRAAIATVTSIKTRCSQLRDYPQMGRAVGHKNTREFVLTPLPYLAVYLIGDDTVWIARILHGAQRQ